MARFDRSSPGRIVLALAAIASCGAAVPSRAADEPTLAGAAAYGDYTKSAPGVDAAHPARATCRRPMPRTSARNASKLVPRPTGAELHLPPGFAVAPLIAGFQGPRQMKLAPNGDIFLAESDAKRIRVIRAGADAAGECQRLRRTGSSTGPMASPSIRPAPSRASSMSRPRGRCCASPIMSAISRPRRKPEIDRAAMCRSGHHWTRDIVFSPDGKRLHARGRVGRQ